MNTQFLFILWKSYLIIHFYYYFILNYISIIHDIEVFKGFKQYIKETSKKGFKG